MRVESRLDRMDEHLTGIKAEIGNAKWWFIGAVLTMVLTVIGTGVSIQQMTVATFQAAAAQPPAAAQPIIINNMPPAAVAAPASAPR